LKYTFSTIIITTLAGLVFPCMAHALSGKVTDANSRPISNAEIEVVGSTLQTRTDALGQLA
jgi:K+-transporting ATPase c subunit